MAKPKVLYGVYSRNDNPRTDLGGRTRAYSAAQAERQLNWKGFPFNSELMLILPVPVAHAKTALPQQVVQADLFRGRS